MTLRWWKTAALVASVGVFGSGCIINVSQTRNPYETCGTGDTCNGASSCASLTVNGTAGSFCSQSCSSDLQCPSRLGNTGSCFMGTCFQKCSGPTDCAAGMACAAVNQGSGTINLCVPGGGAAPCGAIGQACCGGTTCNDAAATCAGDGLCKPRAYNGCTAASVAAAAQCTDAIAVNGSRVQTTCVRPQFANAGPDGYCSIVCNGTNESCPPFPGSTTGCYTFQGMTAPMCFVDCATNPAMCPAGTACVQLTSNSGAQVRVCAPPVSS